MASSLSIQECVTYGKLLFAKVFEGSTVLELLPYQYLLSLEFEVAIMQHSKENRIVLIGGRDDAGNSKSVEVWTSLVMGFSMLLRILKKGENLKNSKKTVGNFARSCST